MQSALAASLIDAPESDEELKSRLARVQSGEVPEFGKKPTILDPFCGFGGVALAAQSLGLPAVASDLNSVAEGLADDVAYYGNLLREKAWEKLKDIYPNEPEGTPSAWIWARTVKCPNPACGCTMPLASSFILCSKGTNEIWAEPVLQDGAVHFELQHGCCPKEKMSNKVGSQGAVFRCPACGSLTTDAYVK